MDKTQAILAKVSAELAEHRAEEAVAKRAAEKKAAEEAFQTRLAEMPRLQHQESPRTLYDAVGDLTATGKALKLAEANFHALLKAYHAACAKALCQSSQLVEDLPGILAGAKYSLHQAAAGDEGLIEKYEEDILNETEAHFRKEMGLAQDENGNWAPGSIPWKAQREKHLAMRETFRMIRLANKREFHGREVRRMSNGKDLASRVFTFDA